MKKYKNNAWNVYSVILLFSSVASLIISLIGGIQIIAFGKEHKELFGENFWTVGFLLIIFTILIIAINSILFFALSKMHLSLEELYDNVHINDQIKEKELSKTDKSLVLNYSIKDNCKSCSTCYTLCPTQAIVLENEAYKIDKDKCIKCGICKESCPYNAIIGY